MKTNELKTGNLLFKNNEVVTVMNIFGPSGLVQFKEEPFQRIPLLVAEIEGIPLTEEWLLKFDFVLTDVTLKKHLDVPTYNNRWHGVFLEYHLLGWYMVKPHIINEIQWVHQLQNIYFDVTREELVLK